jgi:transposase
MKLSGPGTGDLMTNLAGLLGAATEACQAYSMKAVKEMKQADESLQDLHRRRQRLESEVKQLEERKKKALANQPQQSPPKHEMKKGTKPLTTEEQAAHRVKVEAERAARRAENESKREAPLTHQPFSALIEAEAQETPQ